MEMKFEEMNADKFFESVESIFDTINKLDFQKLLGTSNQIERLLLTTEEDGVSKSHICIFTGYLHLIHNLYNPEDVKRSIDQFINIPKKKQQKLFDRKTKEWIVIQLAKVFYKPLYQMKKLPDAHRIDRSFKVYHLMALSVVQFHSKNYSAQESLDIHIEFLKDKYYNSSSKYLLSLLFAQPENFYKYLDEIKNLNLFNNLKYYLNEEINRNSLLLLKYGLNKTLVDFNEEVLEMADSTVQENLENIKSERDEYAQRLIEYEKNISILKKKNSELQIENSKLKNNPILTNLKILVIGDTQHREGYKKIVENHGGDFSFLDGVEEASKSKQNAMKNDLVFHVTAYGFHVVSRQLDGLENVKYVNKAGLQSLDQTIAKLKETI